MDAEDFRCEMGVAGCVQLFHPMMPSTFLVLEQKMDSRHGFLPVEEGVVVFRILEHEQYASRSEMNDLPSVFAFLRERIGEGWRVVDMEHAIDPPKKNFVKWQLCNRVW